MALSNPSNSADGAPAVDFMALLGRCLGNFRIVERAVATFRDAGRSDLNQLQIAIAGGDYAAVVEISHRFKGAASNVSALGLTKLLIRAELSGQEQDLSELTRILADLQVEWESIMCFVDAFAPASTAVEHGTVVQTQDTSEARHACAGC